MTTIHDLALPALVTAAGADPALLDGATGVAIDYATLRSRIGAVSAGLAARGLRPGDVLAVWAPNEPRWAGVALAAMAVGAAVTGIPPGATEREAADQLADARAAALIAATPLLDVARAAADGRMLISFDALAELLAPAPPVAMPGTDAVALLPYSSGTTGLPKGVMLTHRNLVAGARQVEQRLGLIQGSPARDRNDPRRRGLVAHRVEADGNVYVVDRLKELIKVDAHQVAPAELEALLLTHPGVADAAVVGVPDERRGEAPVAFVVGDAGAGVLMAWVAERVAPWKRVRDVVVVDEIPRTPAGKVLRRVLSDRSVGMR